MTASLLKTIKFLTQVDNPSALDLLRILLNDNDWEVRQHAFDSLYLKRNPDINLELYQRFLKEEDAWLRTKCVTTDRLSKIVSEVFSRGDEKWMNVAIKTILKHKLYETLPVIASYVDSAREEWAKLSSKTVLALAEAFYDELANAPTELDRRNMDRRREWLTQQIEIPVRTYASHGMDDVIKAFVLVAKKEYPSFTAILGDIHSKASKKIVQWLEEGEHGSFIRLLLSYIGDADSSPVIDIILTKKQEPRFVRHLLMTTGNPPTQSMKAALKRFKGFLWLSPNNPNLPKLIEGNESAFVYFFTCLNLTKEQYSELFRFTLKNCSVEARRVATECLRNFPTEEYNQILIDAAADSDPIVCSNAMRMLKTRGVKEADAAIMRNVERKEDEVIKAIYDLMPDFHIEGYLQKVDQLPESFARTLGKIIRRIDSTAEKVLKEEITSLVPLRRAAAASAIRFMDFSRAYQESLIKVIEKDEETNVRVAAILALSESLTMEAIQTLKDASADKVFAIRTAATTAVQRWMDLFNAQKAKQ